LAAGRSTASRASAQCDERASGANNGIKSVDLDNLCAETCA
jgi:hypothetical protein